MKFGAFFFMIMVLSSGVAHAGEKDLILMRDAVVYAAEADAYNAYCETQSTLADDFIRKFQDTGKISAEQGKALALLQKEALRQTGEDLRAGGLGCKDLDFLMARLDVMQRLKDVSYRLNRLEPEDVPQKQLPELKNLVQPREL